MRGTNEGMSHPQKIDAIQGCERLTGSDDTFGFHAGQLQGTGVSDRALAAGTDLGGVTILRQLGSGGMGQVYQARQHAPPRPVAVKVVRPGAADPSHRRLDDEAELLGQLDHPHIARVYTVGRRTVAGRSCPWIMMELVEGARTVTEWVHAGRQGVAERVALVHAASEALAAAHSKGVIHLDLKPSNILVDRRGVLKLIDFGIGRRSGLNGRDQRPAEGRIVGTPGSMSPEQLAGRDDLIDARSDIYCLGQVLFELVVGRPPAGRPETPAAARALLAGSAGPLPRTIEVATAARAAGCPRFAAADLAAIVGRCLAVDPAARFSTAWELASELGRWRSGHLLRCRRPEAAERICRWTRRHPAVAILSVLMAFLVITAVTAISWFAVENGRERKHAERAADAARVSLAAALLRQAVAAGRQHEPATVSRLLADRRAAVAALTLPPGPGMMPSTDGLAIRCLKVGLDDAVACWADAEGPMTAVAIAADGSRAIAGDAGGGVTVFSLRGGSLQQVGALGVSGGRVWAAAVSPADDLAAVAGDAGTVSLINLSQPVLRENLVGATGRIYGLAFLPAGDRLVSGGRDGVVRLWDANTHKLIRTYGPVATSVYGVAVSADSKTVAAALRDGSVRLWSVATGESVGQLVGHQGRVFSVAFSPDGRLLASASEDQTVRLWDLAGLSERRRLDHPARVNAVQFTGNERLVTASSDRLLRCWQVTGQRPPRELSGHAAGIWAVATAAGGGAVLSASADGTVRQWDGAGDPQPRLSVDEPVKCLALSTDGRQLAVGTNQGTVSVWDPATGSRLVQASLTTGPINGLCWLPGSGQLLVAAGDGLVGRYTLIADGGVDGAGGCRLEPAGELAGHRRRIFAVAATAASTKIATAGEDKTVRLWTAAGEPAGLLRHPGRVFSVAFAGASRSDLLATGCEDGLMRIFTPEGRECGRADGHRGQVNSVCWNPRPARGWDVASAGADGQVRLWRLPGRDQPGAINLQPVMTLAGAAGKIWQITACRQEPLLVGATDAGEVILWDTHEPSPLEVLAGHAEAVWAVAVGPAEHRLISGGWDKTVRFWGVSAHDWSQRLAE